MSKVVIQKMIDDMEEKIEATEESIAGVRGPVEAALRVVLPIQKDQLAIVQAILEKLRQ